MALDFPASPTVGQTFISGGVTWVWDGVKWSAGGVAGSPVIYVGDTAPTSFTAGTLWFDSVSGQLFVWYVDPSGPGQWVPSNAPLQTTPVSSGLGNAGRNLLHNALFNVNQRGAGPFGGAGVRVDYTSDRWQVGCASGDSVTTTSVALSDAARTQIGDEAATGCLNMVFTGGAGAANWVAAWQKIESVRRLSGKTVIVSFYAVAASGTPKVGVSIDQNFGTGGSPSAGVVGNGQAVTIASSTWARYALTFAVPSTSGKTMGSNGDTMTVLNLWLSAGSSSAAASGNVGVQSGTIQLWGVQLEIAQPGQMQPSPLEKLDVALQLQQCLRFYQAGQLLTTGNASGVGQDIYWSSLFVDQFRVPPTVTVAQVSLSNCGSLAGGCYGTFAVWMQVKATAAGSYLASVTFTASADL